MLPAALACFWVGASYSAWAQQRLDETVVVTANATPVPFENLSRAVTILTREQIARLPVRSVPELLRFAASVEVRARGPFGVQSDFSIRGAGFGQTLVMINGIRINDSQSGHHNGDIPLQIEDIERVEILLGAGSSIHGADAYGGAVNLITVQKGRVATARVSGGEFGLLQASAGAALESGRWRQSLSGSLNRSTGFMPVRDFRAVGLTSQSTFAERTNFLLSFQDKDFGADGFYGPSPSRESTNTMLASLNHRLLPLKGWEPEARLSYRTHGDHFLWDYRRPGFAENRHRTHAAAGGLKASRNMTDRTRFVVGVDAGQEWIRSSNLGDHSYSRGAVYSELEHHLSERAILYPGVRFDTTSHFGGSVSPSLSGSFWVGPDLKLRTAVGHAFRSPTFTELYYSDPNHEALSDLRPENAWGAEAGADWVPRSAWVIRATVFQRWERNVIDWIRERPEQRWQTHNIHRLGTGGLEVGVVHTFGEGFLEAQYTYLSTDAGFVPFLSKYVLDYSRHSFSGFGGWDLPGRIQIGFRIDHRRPVSRAEHWVCDARLTRNLGAVAIFVEGSNLFNSNYQEIQGVQMPPRWLQVGLSLNRFP